MRHKKKKTTFGREKDQRRALMKSLVISFIDRKRISTTLSKAKATKAATERMITRAKNDTLANRRLLGRVLNPRQIKIIFEQIAPVYKSQNGGYIKLIKKEPRKGDGAPMAIIELTKQIDEPRKEETSDKQAGKKINNKEGKPTSKKTTKK